MIPRAELLHPKLVQSVSKKISSNTLMYWCENLNGISVFPVNSLFVKRRVLREMETYQMVTFNLSVVAM